jgi:acyl carrier protein
MNMEEKILEIMRSIFGVEDIDTSVSQKNCEGWDSMAQLNLVIELESEFGVCFEPEEIGVMTSFQEVFRMIKEKTER